jgi:hypothetical protein
VDRDQENSTHPSTVRRQARESISEIANASVGLMWVVVAVALIPYDVASISRLLTWAVPAGEVALDHIGWGFGFVIPTMLGFYAIVSGGQLVGSPLEPRTRRVLGTVAELLFVALMPALFLIIAACIYRPALAGALFVVVPAYLLMLFLSVLLGGFVVFELETRRAAALATSAWARGRIASLNDRSRKAPGLVLVANIAAGAVLGTATSLAVAGPTTVVLIWAAVHLGMSTLLAGSMFLAVLVTRTARDKSAMALSWLPLAFVSFTLIVFVILLWDEAAASGSIGLIVLAVFFVLTAFRLRSRRARVLLDWSIQGVATRAAVRSITRRLLKVQAEIAELKPLDEQQPTVLTRLRRFLRPPTTNS